MSSGLETIATSLLVTGRYSAREAVKLALDLRDEISTAELLNDHRFDAMVAFVEIDPPPPRTDVERYIEWTTRFLRVALVRK